MDLGILMNDSSTYRIFRIIRPDSTSGAYESLEIGAFTNQILDFQVVDDVVDEIVPDSLMVRVKNVGVRVYDYLGVLKLQHTSSQTQWLDEDQALLLSGDMSDDRQTDIITTNLNYINVFGYDGSSSELELLWHHNANHHVENLQTIRYREKLLDLIYSSNDTLFFVSSTQVPPEMESKGSVGSSIPEQSTGSSWIGNYIAFGIIGSIFVVIGVRKRLKLKTPPKHEK